jgi:hypothetical protein
MLLAFSVYYCYQAPLLAYASNYFELRLDGYKLLYLTK